MVLHTIGYEGLTLEQFLALLAAHGIEHLVDIREAATSRKAGFAKAALAAAVAAAGIRYSHVRALGCPKPIRDRYQQTGDWARYSRDVGNYLAGQGARRWPSCAPPWPPPVPACCATRAIATGATGRSWQRRWPAPATRSGTFR